MSRIFTVARREYLERVRSRAFLVGTFLGPVLMAGLMIGPALVAARQRGNPLKVAVLDASGSLGPAVAAALREAKEQEVSRFVVVPPAEGPVEDARARLKQSVLDKKLDGYVYLPPAALAQSAAEYHGRNVSNFNDIRLLRQAIDGVFVSQRLESAGLDAERVKSLTRRLDLKTIRLSERGGEREDRGVTFFFSVTLMMMLYVTTVMWGQAVMTGVIEEKTSRVVELAISAMPSSHLFAGKLLGVGAAGLTQFLVWVLSMLLLALYGGAMAAAAQVPMPEVTPLILGSFVIFFLLGYFLYASLYAAIGSAVNSVQEAQSLVFPALMPLIASMVFFPVVIQSPDSPLSVGLSLFPFSAPLLMFLRITVLTPPLWQIVASMALTAATVVGVNWLAARIYRVGILMYGKKPTFPEILRWVRHS